MLNIFSEYIAVGVPFHALPCSLLKSHVTTDACHNPSRTHLSCHHR